MAFLRGLRLGYLDGELERKNSLHLLIKGEVVFKGTVCSSRGVAVNNGEVVVEVKWLVLVAPPTSLAVPHACH